jgi:nitroreductase/NAD-dependent dihydropyrimidine dehydrogenase PreA subunit
MVQIDQELCSNCGLCEKVCPHKLLHVGEGDVTVADEGCMVCGHCMAVCPVGAIEVNGVTAFLHFETFPEHTENMAPGRFETDRLVQLMRSRRSCRNYREEAVDLDMLEDLVRVGTTAPSGTNSQSWRYTILPERKDVEALGGLTGDYYRELNRQASNPVYRFLARFFAGDALGQYYRGYYRTVREALRQWDEEHVDRLFHGATAAILVTGETSASCPAEDALLASQNILLAAHAMGLGSCLIGFVVEAVRRSKKMKMALNLDDTTRLYSVIALGYPAIAYQRVAGRKKVQPQILHLS